MCECKYVNPSRIAAKASANPTGVSPSYAVITWPPVFFATMKIWSGTVSSGAYPQMRCCKSTHTPISWASCIARIRISCFTADVVASLSQTSRVHMSSSRESIVESSLNHDYRIVTQIQRTLHLVKMPYFPLQRQSFLCPLILYLTQQMFLRREYS